MQFQKAQRHQAKLRLAIAGPSGSGKTLGALMIAKGLGGRVAVIDTERDSASLYSQEMRLPDGSIFRPPEFDVLSLDPPYTPERMIEAIRAAERDYDVLVIDSTTAEWSGMGGCLEMVDSISKAKFGGNSYMAWSAITPRHRAFLDAMLRSPLHVIATMRSKTETAQVEDGGKKKVVKLGMKSEQRDGIEYEFTTVLDLVHDGHYATASKDRTGLFGGDPHRLSQATGEALLSWLESSVAPIRTARDLAIELLRMSETAAEFKEAWSANYKGWQEVMDPEDYRAVQLVKDEMVARFAPKVVPPAADEQGAAA